MAASLHPLNLPSTHPNKSGNDGGIDDDADTSIRGWDHSVLVDDGPPANMDDDEEHYDVVPPIESFDTRRRSRATFHAVARGHTVIGTSSSKSFDTSSNVDDGGQHHNGGDSDEGGGILWQTSLNDTVVTVVSNSNGSVIAAATSTEVSLLKGCDGSVLATRQIASNSNSNSGNGQSSFSPQLLFLSHSSDTNEDIEVVEDVLVMICPASSREAQKESNVILISNINGHLLNSMDRNQVRMGAAKMRMEALSLSNSSVPNNNGGKTSVISWMEGAFVNPSTIRFFLKYQWKESNASPIHVMDYNVDEKKSTLVLENLGEHLKRDLLPAGWKGGEEDVGCGGGGGGNNVPLLVGLGMDNNCRKALDATFLLVASCSSASSDDGTAATEHSGNNGTTIAWINILDLSVSAKYTMPSSSTTLALLSCVPVRSHDTQTCVAAAIAHRTSSESSIDQSQIDVVQSLIGTKSNPNDAMVLFTVNVEDTAGNISSVLDLCAPPLESHDGTSEEAYLFRYLQSKHPSSNDSDCCWEFSANEQVRLGDLHIMLATNDYESAHSLSEETGCHSSSDGNKISTPLTNKSFLSFLQFRNILTKSISENAAEARECLRRMAKAIILSGGNVREEIECLCNASKYLMSWPMNQVANNVYGNEVSEVTTMVSIQEVRMALSATSKTIASVADVIGPSKSTLLEEQKWKLEERLVALKTLQNILTRSLGGSVQVSVTLDDPFLGVDSTVGLLHELVAHGAFKSVELLQRGSSELVHPEALATAALRIPSSVNPRTFLPWLCDVVLPSLSIGHPSLGKIRSWACRAADHYDEENLMGGIDSSILLLQAVSKATARLTVAMNTCFTYASEVSEQGDDELQPITPRDSVSFSFDSTRSLNRSTASHRPTVLNVGMISGMKGKDGRMMSARRVPSRSGNDGNVTATSNTSLDFSFFNSPSPNSVASPSFTAEYYEDGDDDTLDYDCVEYKLSEAIRLKTARGLGMAREVLSLADYSSMGEQYVVKELVKSALLNHQSTVPRGGGDCASMDGVTSPGIVDKIRLFASDSEANFDDAVLQYANELLCDKRHGDIPLALRLHQAQTLSEWCTSPSVKCMIVLKMLRIARESVQQPPDLTFLATEAIGMAADEHVKSELEEASRLLGIDSLVRRYCGNGAQEFFKVDNPSHGLKLVQHVCRHVDAPNVMTDVLMLCDAFNHISKLDTCISLLQRAMNAATPAYANHLKGTTQRESSAAGRAGQCASFLEEIYSSDVILGERVGERMTGFCAEILEEYRKMLLKEETFMKEEARQQAVVASSTACALLSVMQTGNNKNGSQSSFNAVKLLKEFQTISKLQSGCGIFLTLEELRDPSSCAEVVSELLQPSVDLILSQKSLLEREGQDNSLRDELKPLVARARQWCAILCDTKEIMPQVWSRAIGSVASKVAEISTNHASLLLLEVSGLLDERSGHSSYHAIVSVALTLCARAFSEANSLSGSMVHISQDKTDLLTTLIAMKSMAQASQLLREHILLHSPSCLLSASLTFSNLMELVCEISSRSDMGIGERLERYIEMLQASNRHRRQQILSPFEKSATMLADKRLPGVPNLHPTWYIGDGLLLQPLEALSLSMSYCKMILGIESMSPSKLSALGPNDSLMENSEMMHSLEIRGAHATSLRVLMLLAATFMSQSSSPSSEGLVMFPNTENILKQNNYVLAERSIGGTESGLTSGVIDELMSVSFLLHLPKEMAFKVYQAALPSAIGKRDYSRILTLASIGTQCGVGTFSSGESFPWNKQRRFIDQCDQLSRNAIWWSVLSDHNVSFDTSAFSQSREVEQFMEVYCKALVWNASRKLDPRSTLILSRRFVKEYGLNKHAPPSALIEYLLSSSDDCLEEKLDKAKRNRTDIRQDLVQTEAAVRECLAILPTLPQNTVLRKCIMNLEQDSRCAKDYDRHSLALQLYHECLIRLSRGMKKGGNSTKAHEEETRRIDRRQEALVILSSIFGQYPSDKRPEYIKMFEPLPLDPLHPGQNERKFSVLGSDADKTFDPLAPLDGVLEDEIGSESMVRSLAPLCSKLHLPSGYLHARSLVVRFRKLKASGNVLPPFESAVVPVAKKLKTFRDRADLAWWCSLQYDAGSIDQLKCLDMAHSNATEASEEAESSKCAEEEAIALDRVKQIDAARAGLSDKILVDEVLKRHESTTKTVKVLYKKIIDKVQQRAQAENDYRPEHSVQALLVEGSLMAAVASLDDDDGFCVHHFRLLALLVHEACKALSNRYSHVSVGKCARLLTRQWLVHGDNSEGGVNTDLCDANPEEAEAKKDQIIGMKTDDDGDDTSEFVMDIAAISSSNPTCSNDLKNDGSNGITSSEEPSALSPTSLRESSDHHSSRVALRVAFLICFAEDYHHCSDSSPEKQNENVDGNILSKTQRTKSRGKVAQKIRQTMNCFEGDLALQHARELLGIVFAGQGSTIASTYGRFFAEGASYDESILSSVPENSSKDEFHAKSKVLSFAMRYRALRVATILCPQEVIARVVLEETYSSDIGDDNLNKFVFGSFVAMEIEAMGLPLPHSDLIQLSAMHFPSYARTIWRNHGPSSSSCGVSGRLYLLLLELSVNHCGTVDWELFTLIFSELERLELPRSLLLACECAVKSKAVGLASLQERHDVLQIVGNAAKKLSEIITHEVETNLSAGIDFDTSECSSTLYRLVSVITSSEDIYADHTFFVQAFSTLSNLFEEKGKVAVGAVFIDSAHRITNHLTDPDLFFKSSSIVSASSSHGSKVRGGSTSPLQCQTKRSVCSEAILLFEKSFHSS